VVYWTKAYPATPPRCRSCAGKETYVPSKVERSDKRKRGDGYITKDGYHLIYDGGKYKPAHHFAFDSLPDGHVVHHIDGDKLNNKLDNLVPLSKKAHREAHGSLEKVSYSLIQSGLIEYDVVTNSYSLSRVMEKLMMLIPVNSEKPLTDSAEGNSEPSPAWGRCNDYPMEEYARSLVEAQDTQTEKAVGEDIVSSGGKLPVVLKRTGME
jgi:hypothetical protein